MKDTAVPRGSGSKLFQPLKLANGKIESKHRVVLAPLTRNRGTPLQPEKGGLLISEGVPPSLESNGMPGVPGMFIPEEAAGWKKIVDAVHAKGGYIYFQLWHAGRATIPQMTGSPAVSASATVWDDPKECFFHTPVGYGEPVPYSKHPPIELSHRHIKRTIEDYCNAANMAMEAGFDGVELHSGNGYLPEQFLSSNINIRTDDYGGTPEKRCQFVFELMDALAATVGQENLAIRLSPFGLFNQARGEQRVETWTHLCRGLKQSLPNLSYVSFIEPRYEQIFSTKEKDDFLASWGLLDVDLSSFREIFGSTPFFSAGGWDHTNSWGVLESGKYDALLYGRYFISNPDLVERLKKGYPLNKYDRSRLYGPFDDPAIGYTDYLSMEQQVGAKAAAQNNLVN
uniref:NADPH dehydrogenase 1 n=1 Tax=Coccidioides posadasii RMSCC 3488 TaxID=454284 RepID=A0A0J6F3L1_COCPO|nr:NADPH dehydrogenase 1 [Coccidioides posadasii RMSCC 3488]